MDALTDYILAQGTRVFELQKALTALPALAPENGGQGESAKADYVLSLLEKAGIRDTQLYSCPDSRVETGSRPNIIAKISGKSDRFLWLFGHLDVVPPGDMNLWRTDPWIACQQGDYIYGRGVEDNQQAIVSMLILGESLKAKGIIPELGLGLVFMADEECGSNYGLRHILETAPDLFSPEDFFIVADGGSPDGDAIEIAEKAQLWLKFTVLGKQAHASMPERGINALVASARLLTELDGLKQSLPEKNALFDPPTSTFVPTRYLGNVDAVNIMSGREIFYMDCRLLPGVEPENVLQVCRGIADRVENECKVKIDIETIHHSPASKTPPDAPVVLALTAAIEKVYSIRPHPCGIGGATVAAFLRRAGLEAAVWSCIENTCHQSNERSSIAAALKDAAVFAQIILNSDG